ncbi:MAG: hypothetical protein RI953_2155 [Pseudomonadota bacterium]|jgi:23S rRNA pseudouridine1911/1915/1917 synthase
MDLARTLIQEAGLENSFAVMCKTQTAGRGRAGSVWSQAEAVKEKFSELVPAEAQPVEKSDLAAAVRHCGIFGPCTFVVPGHLLKIPVSWLSLAVGCAVADALWRARSRLANMMNFSGLLDGEPVLEAKLKWPNDVWAWPTNVASGGARAVPKKVAGILCESSFRADKLHFVSIGLGLNLFEAPAHVAQAGSVLQMWGVNATQLSKDMRMNLNEIVAEEIEKELADYLFTERSAEQLRHLVLERSLPLGTKLSVNKGQHTGAFLGLSADGGLLLEGATEPVLAADVGFPEPSAKICLDFGNTQIHWRCERGSESVVGNCDWSLLDRKSLSDTKLFAKTEFAQEICASVQDATRVELVWSAVAHAGQSMKVVYGIESALMAQRAIGREILLTPVDSLSVLRSAGLEADYAPNEMGVDRALQAWTAVRKAQDAGSVAAVLSVGTALTGIVVDAKPRMIESFILPGPAMSLQALHEKTARLPKIALPKELAEVKSAPEIFSTRVSMLRGLVLQFRGLVDLLHQRHQVSRLILTGGGAQSLFDVLDQDLQNVTFVEHDLVLKAMSEFAGLATKKTPVGDANQELESEEGLPEKVLQSMLRARISRRRSQRVALDKAHFRRLGGRLEHVGVGLRLDRHLGEKFKFHNRDIWQQRIDIGEVLVEQNSPKNHISDAAPDNLVAVKPTYVLKQGDQIWLFHPPEYEPDMMTNVDVVYDDGDAAVFCKPGNLVVHAAGLYGKNTFIEIAKKMGYPDAAPVHRIDRETSGILVCARSTPLRRDLSLSFRDSSVKKMYLAVCKGTRSLPDQFRVALPIGPAINSRIRLKLWHNPQEGLDALTHCLRLSQWQDYTLFACMPQTGRTNQIRVHLAAIGHWIVGDKMYHPDEDAFLQFYEEGYIESVAEKVLMPRHWLHNTGIQFFSRPDSDLGRKPVIAPLTDDLLQHEPTLELLDRAGIPRDPKLQHDQLAQLFQRVLDIDFGKTPAVEPQVEANV